MYVVKWGAVRTLCEGTHTRAYIEHGAPAIDAKYQYYILKQKNKKTAKRLLSNHSPIEIVAQDNDAHIIRHKTAGIICGALFNPLKTYTEQLVTQVNIPLSYILEKEEENDSFRLSICEPDMRRASRAHMGLLTEEDVVQEEKAFNTQLTINGIYNVKCLQSR